MNKQIVITSFIFPSITMGVATIVSFSMLVYIVSLLGFDPVKLWPLHTRFALLIYLLSLIVVRHGYKTYKRLNKYDNWFLSNQQLGVIITSLSISYIALVYYLFHVNHTALYSFFNAMVWFAVLCVSWYMEMRNTKKRNKV